MVVSATVKVMSAAEIAAMAGGQTPFLHWPQRTTVFAERQMRLRQLAEGHAMRDFLLFVSGLARAQQAALNAYPAVPLPDGQALDRSALAGVPPLSAADWPRDPAWLAALRRIVADLEGTAPAGVQPVLKQLAAASESWLEEQADGLLSGVMTGLDLAAAPVLAAALQVYWTHLLLALQGQPAGEGQAIGRTDDLSVCPACGSRPTSSITRTAGGAPGQRYLHCSLCSLQWHMARIQCSHCLDTKRLAYQSLQAAGSDEGAAGQASVQAETCEACGHYLKIMHSDRDPFVEPAADDLATLTLDLLVAETGLQRHGVNLLLLFGEPDPPDPPGMA